MATAKMRVLGVHGLGDHRLKPWKEEWEAAMRTAIPSITGLELELYFVTYDDIFTHVDISLVEGATAVAKLLHSGVSAIGGAKGIFDLPEKLKWTAGYVVAWLEDEEFKIKSRKRILDSLKEIKPDVMLGHSLGSLITYNALHHPDSNTPELKKIKQQMTYVTLGSQIGNPFVIGNLSNGRIQSPDVHRWLHLFNDNDHVFTAAIRLWDADNYTQIDTLFDIDGWMNHDATEYIRHSATINNLWEPLVDEAFDKAKPKKVKGTKAMAGELPEPILIPKILSKRPKRSSRKRALLVGINEYPKSSDQLAGCVNDTFLISSVLQELKFRPEDIRLCLDDRATASGILDRLEWLLHDPMPGDQLFFFYSGHGAQFSTYGQDDEVDRQTETLVPYDFDWSPETCIADDKIYDLYSQLPYGCQFVMVLDCCHSGGIHRSGLPRAKGLNPPDDIRHRDLQWNKDEQMWEKRKLAPINKSFSPSNAVRANYFGQDGSTVKIGRASALRLQSEKEYKTRKASAGDLPIGPYLPMIIEACQENELAYEYRHGVVSYGAFTYAMATILRRYCRDGITFNEMVKKTSATLKNLGYSQQPQILGPTSLLDAKIPW